MINRIKFFLVFGLLILSGMVYSYNKQDIEQSVQLYQTDREKALDILKAIISTDRRSLGFIKAGLLEKQSYPLYRDFLHSLPAADMELSDETMNMDFVTGNKESLPEDIGNSLLYQKTVSFDTLELYRSLVKHAVENAGFCLIGL